MGSSNDWFWLNDGINWAAYFLGGDPVANFGARLEAQSEQHAVSEPATMSLLAVGVLGLLARRRRSC